MKNPVNKKFKISAKRLFLTYSQVNPKCTIQHVLELLKTKFNFSNISYLVSRGNGQHKDTYYHALLTHFDKFQITNSQELNIKHNGQVFHGQYTFVKSLKQAVMCGCKNKEYVTNFKNLH